MKTILVIEDETSIRQDIVDILKYEGYAVFAAGNGRIGLELAHQCQPDLILCDVMMPEVDGFEVLGKLRTESQTSLTPFIFLTARTGLEDMRTGMGMGADDYLTKPFTPAQLLEAVRTRLERYYDLIVGPDGGQLEEAQRKLTRMVAHELRTPLISIRMVQDILRRSDGKMAPEQFNDLLDSLESGTRRMSHLVEQMVYTTQLEAGMLAREAVIHSGTVLHLGDLLTATIPIARQFATRQRTLDIQVDARDQDVNVLCDVPSLKHALAELIANAINFSPDDGQVTVSQWVTDETIWITILDHGRGMASEKIDEAMRAFYQIDRESQEQQGVGMGLPLAWRIIDIHGGTVALESAEGKGTQVTVSLPSAE